MILATTSMPRKKGPPAALRLDTPVPQPQIAQAVGDSSASTSAASSAISEADFFPFRPPSTKPKSLRNMKRLSLTLPTDDDSTNLSSNPPSAETQNTSVNTSPDDSLQKSRPRRLSVASLPTTSINPKLHRKEEDGSPTVPYLDGPIQILPGIWLGSEDNARDWKCLVERRIKSILNVAKEVTSPFDSAAAQPMRPFASTPNLYKKASEPQGPSNSTFYPAHIPSGRPGMHYLKLQWSHGEGDLVQTGFPTAMAFVDAALERDEGVLIHCQCGISRSATLVIALVMRAAALCTPSVPPEVWALKGYQEAYSFVKQKSKWVGPNMSLIYQLMEYERFLKAGNNSPTPSERSSMAAEEEEEWGRRRRMLDEAPSDSEEYERERDSAEVAQEARALDKAMEDRILARKSSASSVASSQSGVGMGAAWRSRYGDRKRAGSVASNFTSTGSVLSEDLVEEEEEEDLLGVGGGFDTASSRHRSSSGELESASECDGAPSTLRAVPFTPLTARPVSTPRPPPSAPAFQSSFQLPPVPQSAKKSSFGIPLKPQAGKPKRRPPPLGLIPPPASVPIAPATAQPRPTQPRARTRTESRKPSSPPLHLRNSTQKVPFPVGKPKQIPSGLSTPSQTLFVFPPESAPAARTPSTMTLTSNFNGPVPFPSLAPPRISTSQRHGRTRSFIGLGAPPTPTTAFARVDAKGWIGME